MTRALPGILVLRFDDGGDEQVELSQDVTTIGRSDSCAVVVPLPTVSRLHASIVLEHDHYMLADANSANGTFVNGRRLGSPHQLSTDDEIWFGSRAAAARFIDPEETMVMPLEDVAPQLEIDEQARIVRVHGAPADLSPLEYRLLLYLARHIGTVCTREACFLEVWGQPYDHATCETALNACVTKLRRNLRAAATQSGKPEPAIESLRQMGIRLNADAVFDTPHATPDALDKTLGG